MIMSTLPASDLDELARRSTLVVDELQLRLDDPNDSKPLRADVKRLREIYDDGRLTLDDIGRNKRLTVPEMVQIVDRATFLLSGVYVHLMAKRALYASDPLQALRNLKAELGANPQRLNEEQFHEQLAAIFSGLRDCHTNYYLPAPYRRTLVFLPFLVEAADERYVVTKIAAQAVVADDVFRVPREGESPVEVTHINGVPIKQAVARNGEDSAGSTAAARHARGVSRLTFRWLGLGVGPREEWVDLRFTVDGQPHERRFEWLAAQQPASVSATGQYAPGISHDLEGEWIRTIKAKLYSTAPEPVAATLRSAPAEPKDPWTTIERGVAKYRTYPASADAPAHGYLRIFTFEVRPTRVAAFVGRIENILRRAPVDGLIIDIRGNPGGNVLAAESLLQLFSSRPVSRQGLQLLNTPVAAALARPILGEGFLDLPVREAAATGAPFVVFPELPRVNKKQALPPAEQVYQGPVVVIVDAGCYSASEMFAAGMQDNRLASIVGTHAQTGGGGGIVWSDESLAKVCRDRDLRRQLAPLPREASFEVAVLRTTRSRSRVGVAVEDMGVVVPTEHQYHLTRDDVLGDNEGLRAFATGLLLDRQKPCVTATYARGRYRLAMQDLDRIDVHVDGVPVTHFANADMPATFVAPPTGSVEFRGFRDGEFVTSYRPRRRSPRSAAPPPPSAQDREV
jgi:C-terminal processing protease CtpA/Prc